MKQTAQNPGTLSVLSIGIGGMVGGGIFAVTGLTVQLTRGAAPLAFAISGVIALLTSYSYLKLTLRFPSEGDTVEFHNRAFGTGTFTGTLNILLCMSYVVLVAVYAYAFASYGVTFFPEESQPFWLYTLITTVVVGLAFVNYFGGRLVVKSENVLNGIKMLLLAIFVTWGLATPLDVTRMGVSEYVPILPLVSGSMVIF